jgi:hypothetical protein
VPLPSKNEFNKLFKSLEAYNNDEADEVDYKKVLEAPVRREQTSINGIFPKIVISILNLSPSIEIKRTFIKAIRGKEEARGGRKEEERYFGERGEKEEGIAR